MTSVEELVETCLELRRADAETWGIPVELALNEERRYHQEALTNSGGELMREALEHRVSYLHWNKARALAMATPS